MMALTLRVLLENQLARGADSGLRAKAGLSLLLEDETTSILFDTGPDDSFQYNAERMGISLDNLTATVLSHGHYDHCGGVPWLPDNSRIICHPTIGNERYAALNVAGRSHKIKKLSLEIDYARHRMEYTRAPLHISDRFIWSGEIAVDSPKAYGVTGDQTDYVIDEGVLIYLSERGLVIITGCVSAVFICAVLLRARSGRSGNFYSSLSPIKSWAATAPARGENCGCRRLSPRQPATPSPCSPAKRSAGGNEYRAKPRRRFAWLGYGMRGFALV